MQIYEKIDWLSVTFPKDIGLKKLCDFLPDSVLTRMKSPIPVYSHAYEYCGVKFLLGHPNAGIHMIVSGRPLDALRLIFGFEIKSLYDMILECGGKPSRIDLAVDVHGAQGFTVNEVWKRHSKEQCVTRLNGSKFIGENQEIQTFYIGNIKSKSRKIRVYNKGLEDGQGIPDWVRIEYEKRRGSLSTFKAFISGQKISAIIKSAVDFPTWDLWQEIIGQSTAIIPRDKLEHKDELQGRIDWINESAAPAIAKVAYEQYRRGECDDIHDAPVFDSLSGAIAVKLRELMHFEAIEESLIG